ncbi:Gfo/Idh/MocA family oxidoreductase [Leifsonia shinshuensis]|uniref:Gfo/Idh/MocA family protein n=1 Tax=Leifsonia shinshuensis TaxID=150026 RepID=UPI001F50DBF2|nr:Gfo/Idh/MocA family oxidoreductase [Leifsonia shinshuensis]MCI0158374.1 Gfo/Idh/MocA family oxidoreductase [Leifsonia shinshuensis]
MTRNTDRIGVGIVGCGNISGAYFRGLDRFDGLQLVGCTDLSADLARAAGERYGVRVFDSVESLAADDQVDILVNLTPPLAHESVTRALLATGKHVFTEKPLTASFASAAPLVAEAEERGVLFGSAPDTFLGAAGQTARAAVDEGLIGEVIGASAFVTHSKAELWHPDPTFLFQPGGGPALDMGPYYIAALVNLLGPVASVYASARIGSTIRPVSTPGRRVESIDVTIPTHASATLDFASGAIGTVLASFDVWDHRLPFIELYGSKGTLSVPDPNNYDDTVKVRLHGDTEWSELTPVIDGFTDGVIEELLPLRGPGVADLAGALNGEPFRTSADFALHVLEVLDAIANGTDGAHTLTTTCERPAPSTVTWNSATAKETANA